MGGEGDLLVSFHLATGEAIPEPEQAVTEELPVFHPVLGFAK